MEIAIRWIGGRLRFEREVRGFLRRKGVSASEITETMDRLRELGLVSDEETSRAFLRDRLRFAPKGRSRLLAELLTRGASAETAQNALHDVVSTGVETEAAVEFLTRSARKWRSLPEGIARHRAWAALARRGFPRDAAGQALSRVLGAAATDEEFTVEEGAEAAPGEP